MTLLTRLCQHLQSRTSAVAVSLCSWPRLLVLGFIAQLSLIGFVTLVGLQELNASSERLRTLKDEHALRQQLSYTMQAQARERTLSLTRLVNLHDLFAIDAEQLRFHAHGQAFMVARRQLLALELSPDERRLLQEQWHLIQNAKPYQNQVIDLSLAQRLGEASEVLIRHAVPAQDAVLQSLSKLDDLTRKATDQAWEQASQTHQTARHWVITLSLLALALGVIIALVVVRLMHRIGLERERLATHDPLSGLPNRTLLMDRLEQAILRARRQQDRVGLLFIDLDGFKAINDSLGHSVGDELLKTVATRLQQVVRANDIVARLGGDEFVIGLVDAASRKQIEQVCQKVLSEVSRPMQIGAQAIAVSGSVGVCVFPDDGQDASALLRCADFAMYAAKRAGKNQARLFTPSLCPDPAAGP